MSEETNPMVRLLLALGDGRPRSCQDLARELGISETMLLGMLDALSKGGYLRHIATECEAACDSCPLMGVCQLVPGMWVLSEKGHQAIRRR